MTFEVREEAVGIGQMDSIAKFGVEESVGRSGEVLEDDYGIAVIPEKFIDIVTGIDPSKMGGTGRLGEDVLRRGLGFGSDGRPVLSTGTGGVPVGLRSSTTVGSLDILSFDLFICRLSFLNFKVVFSKYRTRMGKTNCLEMLMMMMNLMNKH